MKVLIPVNDADSIMEAYGLSDDVEFYAGYDAPAWYQAFGEYEDMNRMSAFRKSANMPQEHLDALIGAARKCNCSLYVTVNAGIYSADQEKWLEHHLYLLKEKGVDGIILGDPHLAGRAKKIGLKIIASTMIGVYNAGLAELMRDLGFNRIILPRDLSIEEMRCITTCVPDVEYECFLMRNGCRYSDSHCLARHSDHYGALCGYLDHANAEVICDREAFDQREEACFNHYVFTSAFHKQACGQCAIWDCIRMGMTAGKLVGRADGFDSIRQDLRITLKNIAIARKCSEREEYLEKMELPDRMSKCMKGCNCYYPEIRFPASCHQEGEPL